MHSNGIAREFPERKEEIISARLLRFAQQRVADVSESLSRRGAAQAKAELANEAVGRLIDLCYERDTDGQPCNIDAGNGRLLIPVPWGRRGRSYYGLRPSEADLLRCYLQHLQTQRPARLFFYDKRSWWLNCWDYPEKANALWYWRLVQLDAGTWKKFEERVKNG